MSANVEERIVQMQFDNAAFEARAQNTISTLNMLSEALEFRNATRGFGTIEDAASRINFEKLNSALDLVNYRFSTIGIIATNVLNKITDKAIETGKAVANALVFKGAKDGFHEYELLMDSTKQIYNSAKTAEGKPVTLDQVKNALAELNEYADKTIYSFSDMTSNIGKFTNKGIDLDRSVAAIQGVANVAALAGAKSEQASGAMEAFAKAIGQTYMTQRYWFSITAAQMDNTTFKDELIKTAIDLKTLQKEGEQYQILTENNQGKRAELMSREELFLSGLAYKWMSADVMVDTLARFTDEEEEVGKKAIQAATEVGTFSKMVDTLQEAIGTGWADTWQQIFGDYNESKEFWTRVSNSLSDVISTQAKARNALVKDWNVLGGRKAVIDGLFNAWQAILNIVNPIKEAFAEVFPPITAWQLVDISAKFRSFTEQLIIGEDAMENVKQAARGFFSIFDIAGQIISAAYRAFIEPITELIKLDMKLDWVRNGAIGKLIADFAVSAKKSDLFYNALVKLRAPLDALRELFEAAEAKLEEFLGFDIHTPTAEELTNFLTNLGDRLAPLAGLFASAADGMTEFFRRVRASQGFTKFADAALNFLKTLGQVGMTFAKTVLGSIGAVIKTLFGFFKNVGELKFDSVLDLFNTASFAAVGASVKRLVDSLEDPVESIKTIFSDVKKITEIPEKLSKAFSTFVTNITKPLKALTESLRADILIKIALAIMILAGAMLMLSSIESTKMANSVLALLVLMEGLTRLFKKFDELSKAANAKDLSKLAITALIMGLAIGRLAKAVVKLGEMDNDDLVAGVIAVGVLGAALVLLGKLATKLGSKGIETKGMLGLAVAMLLISKSVVALAALDPMQLESGVEAVLLLMAGMTAMSSFGGSNFSGKGLLAMSASILILGKAVEGFGKMDPVALDVGLQAVAGLMVMMGFMSKYGGKNFSGMGFITMAAALLIIKKAVVDLSELDPKALAISAGIVAALMGLMGLISKYGGKNVSGMSMVLMAAAILMLKNVIEEFAELAKTDMTSFEDSVRGVAALLAVMTAMTVVGTNGMATAASMVVMAAAIRLLVPAVIALGNVPFSKLLIGAGALAALFGGLYLAAKFLGPVAKTLLLLSGSIALLGASIGILGVGLFAAGAGLASFSLGLASSVTSIIGSIGILIGGIIGLIPLIVVAVVKAITDIIVAIADSASVIIPAIVKMGMACLEALRQLIPKFSSVIVELIMFFLALFTEYTPTLVNALVELVIQLIDGVATAIYDNSDRIIASVHHLLLAILDLILSVLQEILRGIPGIGGKIDSAIGDLRQGLKDDFDKNYAEKLGSEFTQGIASGVDGQTDTMKTAGTSAGEAGKAGLLDALSGAGPEVLRLFGDEIPAGITGATGDSELAAGSYASTIMGALSDNLSDGSDTGAFLDQGIANGILENTGLATDAGSVLGDDLVQSINEASGVSSPSTKTWETGMYLDQGLANGITDNQGIVSTALSGLGTFLDTVLSAVFRHGGGNAASAFGQGMRTGKSVEASASSLNTRASAALQSGRGVFSQNGIISGSLYASGLRSKAGETRVAGTLIGTTAVTGAGSARVAFGSAGISSGGRYASGISSKSAEARRAGSQIGTSAANGAKSVGGFYEAGRDSGQGYLNGLLSKAKEIGDAAARVVGNALQRAKDTIDSHSPSRAYMELGENSDEGYIIGVERKSGKVNTAMEHLALNAMNVFYEAISRANTLANDALYVSPTVTPVLDLDNVRGGVDFLSGMFGDTGGILGSITADVDNNIEDIREIKENMKEILSALSNRRPISIDGKTVIGWVDTELGAL